MGVATIAVVVMAISKQPVQLGDVMSGAPLLVAQSLLPTEGSDSPRGNNYNWFAAQLAALHANTCENWVDINGIPIQEEERLTSSWEDVLYSEEEPGLKIFVLEIQTSLLRVGCTGILKLGIGYW